MRADLEPLDVFFLITAAGQATPCRFEIPGLWRRYLGVILDGMRPAGASPLTPGALSLDEYEAAVEGAASESPTRAQPSEAGRRERADHER